MEVYHNGEWGTVCDNGWDFYDAEVVCNELGYGRAIAAKRGGFYGKGSGNIWLDHVNCIGNELTIRNCSHRGWGIHDCRHKRDAGVKCTSGTQLDSIFIACIYVCILVLICMNTCYMCTCTYTYKQILEITS